MRSALSSLALAALLSACAAPNVGDRLARRSAEAIDPRVPVERSIIELADPEIEARVAELVRRARAGDAAFTEAFASAQRLSAGAGSPQSESWIAAQQAVSLAVAAREPVTRALGDLDAVAADLIARQNGMGAGAFRTIRSAQAEVAELDRREAAMLEALQRQLGG